MYSLYQVEPFYYDNYKFCQVNNGSEFKNESLILKKCTIWSLFFPISHVLVLNQIPISAISFCTFGGSPL